MDDHRQLAFELDDDDRLLGLLDASVARRLLVEAEAKSRKAKHDERQQQFQRALAEPGPRWEEYNALADATVTNARNSGLSAHVTTDAYVPVDVNHASLSAAAGTNVGTDATAVGLTTHDGASPSPLQTDDLSSFMSKTGGATAAVFDTAALLSVGAGASTPATESMTVTTDKADYAPGSTGTFIVAGVNSGSSVGFQIADLASNPGINGIADVYAPFSVTDGGTGDADGLANGAVVAKWQVPADGSATGAVLQVTAASDNQTATTTFSDSPNKIVSENLKTGTPQSVWAIHGSIANQGDSQIEGFATQISTNAGQTVSFKIDTASSGYTLDIYRLGYYGGNGAHLITTMHHSGADNQPNPIFNSATRTVDAGNWSVTDSWAIPSTAVSGVYFAKLTTDSGNLQNMIPFIVRNDGTTSDMLFQTSDTTWEAYNPWGAYNLYQGPSGSNSDRAYAVSYNRPIAMNSTNNLAGPQDFLFGEEYAAIYWLEQNGYDLSYISGIDAATNAALLLNTKSYIDVGHDEYWSQSQYANVKAAADAGVNLAFLSGNQTYWDIELAPSLDASATPNRTIIEYKDIWSGAQLDPNGTSNGGAGLFRDPVYGPGTPENALSGTIFTVDDFGSLDNISIPASMSQLRFWANTSIASGNGGTLTRLLGYEWDSDLDNGFRPAGLIDLSSTTRNVSTLLLDNGATTGSGTATHSLTLYRDTTSGALVFGAGTVMWSWGLSNQYAPYHGLTAPVSSAVQQSMVNLFADMGVSPQTLQASLALAQASSDHTSPTAVITSPTSGSSVSQGQTVTITGTAADVGGRVAGIEVSTDGGATWHPAAGTTNWSYTWTASGPGTHVIEARATDDSVNLQSSPATLSVNVTGSTTPSLFASNTPAQTNLNDGSPLEVGVKFQSSVAGQITALKFYRSSGDTGLDLLDLWTSTGTGLASVTFTNTAASGWQTVNLSTPVSIAANTTYIASYHTNGFYVATDNFFTTAFTSGVLTAPSTTTAGGNGVYAYGGSSTIGIFPSNTFGAANYWADVVFASSASNTAPTAVADTADAAEKGGVANGSGGSPAIGNVLTNDTDPDPSDTKTVTAVSFGAVAGTLGTALAGAHGSLVLSASGNFTYTVNETDAAVQALRQSTDTATDVFSYTMRDTAGATSTTTLTVAIHGANDAPTLAAQTGSQNATVGSAFSLVLPAGTFTDIDTGDSLAYTATAADGSSLPGWLSFNAATRTFGGTPATGDLGTLGVKVSATDLGSLAASETFNIVVTTTPDTAPTAVADTADATEKGGVANGSGGSPATGNVLANDTDPDAGDTKTVTVVSFGTVTGTLGTALAGGHGSLVLAASGDFTYTVNETDAAVQALRQSTDTLTDVFSYTMRDTAGATSTTTLTVTIHGADDAPTISNLAPGATSIAFVASDPDDATLSLATLFATAFGNPSITSGATTTLTPSARTTAVSGTLQVTDGSYPADVIGLYLGTSGNNTATASNPTAPNAMYGFGGVDTLTGGTGADTIVGGAGADALSGGVGNDAFYLANGDFASGESIDGGADADTIVLTNATTVNFTSGTVGNVETLTGSSGNDTVTMSANQWAGFNTINLGSGTNVLNVVASGDISAATAPTVGNVTAGNLTGTSGNDSITLTGAQLDAIIIGAGTINLGAGTDTIDLTSTSADLNTLGATNASIQGVEAISAATAASGVTIMLSGQTEGFTITGSANNDTITGGRGADTITGGAGVDRFVFSSASSLGTVGGSGNAGTITGYDVISDFSVNAGGDVLDMPNVNVRANETVNGTDSVLTIGGQTIKSHQINNGIITFSNNDTFSSGTTLNPTSLADVAAAVDYIHRNDFATSTGANIGFVANIGGTPHTYIFDQVANNPSAANDILVDLPGVTLTSLTGANLAPAGVAGEAINLGLTNPIHHLGSFTVNISGVPSGWTLSEGTNNRDGTWSVQTYDVSALTITAPENYAGAVSLQISQTWADPTGGAGLAMITDNVEAYAPGGPVFAIAGDDNLSGSTGNDVFVLAGPIGNDTIHSFDAAHDKIDLIAFSNLSSVDDVQTSLFENSNGDAVITIAEGQSITFVGVSPKTLTADNFVFNIDPVIRNVKSIAIGDNAIMPLAGTINNGGTIELASIGSETRLQVLANGLTLEGGGNVELSDGNGNVIAGTTPDATLTNLDNTISGAGQLGEGRLTLNNAGTIIASGSNALTIDTGANEVVNSGTLRATGSGGLVIRSDIANSGLLWANGGNITTNGKVSGTGSALIDGVATFETVGAFSGDITLEAGAHATLKIDHAGDFHGTLVGFDSNDLLNLADLTFGSSTTLGYAANSNDTGGTLTASDGAHTANIALLGQYAAASFVMSADNFGGTLIQDVAPAALTLTLAQPQHA
jgi:VCBS repeat-containing protein